jgi:hypothetical protein
MSRFQVLDEIAQRGCLTAQDVQFLETRLADLETREKLDALDARWNATFQQFATRRRRHKGPAYPQTVSEATTLVVLSGLFLAYVAWMAVTFLFVERDGYDLPLYFFATGTVVLAIILWLAIKGRRKACNFAVLKAAYLEERDQLVNMLSEGHRPLGGFCRNCLDWARGPARYD